MATPAFEDIAETFEFLDNWEDRYRHVIELGRAMPPMDAALQVPATKVEGCASQVWIMPQIEEVAVEVWIVDLSTLQDHWDVGVQAIRRPAFLNDDRRV